MRRPKLALREMQPAEYRMLGITLDSKSELWVHPDTYEEIMSARAEGICMGAAE